MPGFIVKRANKESKQQTFRAIIKGKVEWVESRSEAANCSEEDATTIRNQLRKSPMAKEFDYDRIEV